MGYNLMGYHYGVPFYFRFKLNQQTVIVGLPLLAFGQKVGFCHVPRKIVGLPLLAFGPQSACHAPRKIVGLPLSAFGRSWLATLPRVVCLPLSAFGPQSAYHVSFFQIQI